MKIVINNNATITLLEQRIINEEYAKAKLERQTKLLEMRELITNLGKNGGVI